MTIARGSAGADPRRVRSQGAADVAAADRLPILAWLMRDLLQRRVHHCESRQAHPRILDRPDGNADNLAAIKLGRQISAPFAALFAGKSL